MGRKKIRPDLEHHLLIISQKTCVLQESTTAQEADVTKNPTEMATANTYRSTGNEDGKSTASPDCTNAITVPDDLAQRSTLTHNALHRAGGQRSENVVAPPNHSQEGLSGTTGITTQAKNKMQGQLHISFVGYPEHSSEIENGSKEGVKLHHLVKQHQDKSLTLRDICQGFPNHLNDSVIGLFINEGWSANQIYKNLPMDCQDVLKQRDQHHPANVIHNRVRRMKLGKGNKANSAHQHQPLAHLETVRKDQPPSITAPQETIVQSTSPATMHPGHRQVPALTPFSSTIMYSGYHRRLAALTTPPGVLNSGDYGRLPFPPMMQHPYGHGHMSGDVHGHSQEHRSLSLGHNTSNEAVAVLPAAHAARARAVSRKPYVRDSQKPRPGYNLKNIPHFPGYLSCDYSAPEDRTCRGVAKMFPNSLHGRNLDAFIRHGWTPEDIFESLDKTNKKRVVNAYGESRKSEWLRARMEARIEELKATNEYELLMATEPERDE